MQSHEMRRFTIIAPHVKNDGSMSGYPEALREALLLHGIDGWTEYETHGSWRGKREAGVTFEILIDTLWPYNRVRDLGAIARNCMPDQDAVQVTLEPGTVDVYEA